MPVLVVGTLESERQERADALGRAGFTTLPVAGFLEARDVLTEIEPEALVTDVQLGDYNGLHLVAIAQVEHPRSTCVVVGPRDPALQSESYHLGARYLVEPIAADRVAAILAELVATPRPQRRWPRKRPGPGSADVRLGHRGPDRRRQLRRRRHRGLRRRPADGAAAHRARDRHGGAGRAGLGPPHLQGAAD